MTTDLADLVQYTGFSPEEMVAAKRDGHVSTCHRSPWECVDCMDWARTWRRQLAAVREVIRAQYETELAEAGRLLPEGSEVRPEWQVLWKLTDGQLLEWGCESSGAARSLLGGPPEDALTGVVRSRQHWSSPWTAVEPAAVEGARHVD